MPPRSPETRTPATRLRAAGAVLANRPRRPAGNPARGARPKHGSALGRRAAGAAAAATAATLAGGAAGRALAAAAIGATLGALAAGTTGLGLGPALRFGPGLAAPGTPGLAVDGLAALGRVPGAVGAGLLLPPGLRRAVGGGVAPGLAAAESHTAPSSPPSVEDGAEEIVEGLRKLFEGLAGEMEPLAEDFAKELSELWGEIIDDVEVSPGYHPPEVLPNGDIILRKKAPQDPAPDGDLGVDEDAPKGEVEL